MALISSIYGNNLYNVHAIKSSKKKTKKLKAKKGVKITQREINRMCRAIGLSCNTKLVIVANTYAKHRQEDQVFSNNKEARAYLISIRDSGSVSTNKKTSSVPAVASNEFLESYEWRKIRLTALKLHGRKCQCCGATPETGAVMNVDHIKPRRNYPELALDINNLQVLCHECNHGKGNWDETDFRR